MEFGPGRLRDRTVRGVADEDVPEAVSLLARQRRAVRLDELLADECLDAGRSPRPRLLGHQLDDRTGPELAPDNCGTLDHAALVGVEPIEASIEERLDRGGDGQLLTGKRPLISEK